MKKKRLSAALAGLGLAAAGILSGGSASADPAVPPYLNLNGVGAETTQQLMNALSNTITINGSKVIGSWDATGSVPFQTETSSACVFNTRPDGGRSGRSALVNSLMAGDNCLQFDREDELLLTSTFPAPSIMYVPFAQENVTFMVTAQSNVPRNLSLTDLQGIYTCNANYAGITAILPQPGSGTRLYWEDTMGITEADLNAGRYPCVWNGVTPGGQTINDGDGRVLTANAVAPISVAQNIGQEEGSIADIRGQSVLGTVSDASNTANPNNTYAITQNLPQTITSSTAFSNHLNREVYNVIPSGEFLTAPWSTVFVGSGSLICQQPASTFMAYGFLPVADCGSTVYHN